MRWFVWTPKGKTVHVSRPSMVATECGRPISAYVSAEDVLWYQVCSKCRAAIDR